MSMGPRSAESTRRASLPTSKTRVIAHMANGLSIHLLPRELAHSPANAPGTPADFASQAGARSSAWFECVDGSFVQARHIVRLSYADESRLPETMLTSTGLCRPV